MTNSESYRAKFIGLNRIVLTSNNSNNNNNNNDNDDDDDDDHDHSNSSSSSSGSSSSSSNIYQTDGTWGYWATADIQSLAG